MQVDAASYKPWEDKFKMTLVHTTTAEGAAKTQENSAIIELLKQRGQGTSMQPHWEQIDNVLAHAVAEIEHSVPMLQPNEGEVLIRVLYAGINGGCETFRVRGEHAFAGNRQAAHFALGAEGAGVIEAIGPGVTGLCVGRHVTFVGGAFSEYVIAKAALCWEVSEATPEMVALTISGTVANAALTYVAGIGPGDTVLVTAGAGATGSFAAQIAKAAGCTVVATCGGETKAKRLRELQLDRVIDYTKEDVEAVLNQEFGGQIDVAYEGVGGKLQRIAWNALRRGPNGGQLLAVGYISEYPHVTAAERRRQELDQGKAGGVPLESAQLFWGGDLVKSADGRVALGKVWPTDRRLTLKAKAEVFEAHAAGALRSWVDDGREFHGLDSVSFAIEYMLTGKAIGKVVVRI